MKHHVSREDVLLDELARGSSLEEAAREAHLSLSNAQRILGKARMNGLIDSFEEDEQC